MNAEQFEEARPNGQNVLEIIRRIKIGNIDPRNLSPDDRQLCVMHLGIEGLSVPEIAQVLHVCERTILRDRKVVQEQNAIEHDPQLAGRIAGQLIHEVEVAITRMRRAVRDKDTPPAVKIEAERACIEVFDKMTHRLQSLGYLPRASQRIEAALTHRLEDQPTLEELGEEIIRLKQIGGKHSPEAEMAADAGAIVVQPKLDN